MDETIYLAKANRGQGDDEYDAVSPSLDHLLKEVEGTEGEAVEVGEYKLVRTFTAKRTVSVSEV